MTEPAASLPAPHLLIVSAEAMDAIPDGSCWQCVDLARALAGDLLVTLALPSGTDMSVSPARLVGYDPDRPGSLRVLVDNADIAVLPAPLVARHPALAATTARRVIDLSRASGSHVPSPGGSGTPPAMDPAELARIGSFFLCGDRKPARDGTHVRTDPGPWPDDERCADFTDTDALKRFCLAGRPAPGQPGPHTSTDTPALEPRTLRWAVRRLAFLLRHAGVKTTVQRGWRFVLWKLCIR